MDIYHGTTPVVLVAPHGLDDVYTAEITKEAARCIHGSYIINDSFKRGSQVDEDKNIGNCNDLYQIINSPVLKRQFLNPILDEVNRFHNKISILRNFTNDQYIYYFTIHGVGNNVKKLANDEVDIILGCGDTSQTCDGWYRNTFAYYMHKTSKWNVYLGKSGGNYTANRKSNITQLFKVWNYPAQFIQSMQIEIVQSLRTSKTHIKTANLLAETIIRSIDPNNWTANVMANTPTKSI